MHSHTAAAAQLTVRITRFGVDRGRGAASALRSQVLAQDRERRFVQPEYAVVVFVFP